MSILYQKSYGNARINQRFPRKYLSTKLYEDEKIEKERTIAELNRVKQLYGQAIDTNKQLREQTQLLDRSINVYKNKLSGLEVRLRVTEQENAKIKISMIKWSSRMKLHRPCASQATQHNHIYYKL